MDGNAFEMISSFFEKLLAMVDTLKEFMTREINILGYEFSVWGLIGGSLLVTILIIVLIKAIL